jgi:hypothetical protein
MTFWLGSLCILIGVLPLAVGYFQVRLPQAALASLVIGLLWFFLKRRGWAWVAPLGFFFFIFLAGLGIWMGMSTLWMAVSVLGSLCAWDLEGFSLRLKDAAPGDPALLLEKRHLQRLALLVGTAALLVLLAIFLRVPVSFGWMFLLALAAVLGILQLVDRLRRGV